MKKKPTKKTTKKKETKQERTIKKVFSEHGKVKAILVSVAGSFRVGVALIENEKKYKVIAKFNNVVYAAKFCDLLNK